MGTTQSSPANGARSCCESRGAERGWLPDCCSEELDKGDRVMMSTSSRASVGSFHTIPAHKRGHGHALTHAARDALQEGKQHWAVERESLTAGATALSERMQRVQNEISESKKEISHLKDQRLTVAIKEGLAVARAKLATQVKELEEEKMRQDSIIAKCV